jgi:hypothetical protein
LIYHRKIIKHLEVHLVKDLDLRIRELSINNGTIEGILEHPIFKAMSVLCADLLKSTGPENENFVTANLHHEGQRYEMTVQKAWGKTPADKIAALENELKLCKDAKETPGAV